MNKKILTFGFSACMINGLFNIFQLYNVIFFYWLLDNQSQEGKTVVDPILNKKVPLMVSIQNRKRLKDAMIKNSIDKDNAIKSSRDEAEACEEFMSRIKMFGDIGNQMMIKQKRDSDS